MVTRVPATAAFERCSATVERMQMLRPRSMAAKWLAIAEKSFTVIMLFYTAGAVVPLLSGADDPQIALQTNPVDLAVKAILYSVAFFLLALRWRTYVEGAWRIKWILVPVLIAALSVVWSQHPLLTLRGAAVLVATTAFGIYFGVRYTIAQQLRLLAWAFSFAVVASFCFVIFLPMYGIDQGVTLGDWRGVFVQKNGLAEAMVFAFFVFLFVRPRSRLPLRWVGIAASLALLFLSGSATGIVVCFAMLAILPLYRLAKARFTLVIPVILCVSLLVAGSLLIVQSNPAEAFELVNRSPDLTGRTELWNAVLHSISKRPWLGYGFSAFWEGTTGESGSVLDAIGYPVGYSHNGFLDVLVQLGILGLVTFAAGYLLLWRRAFALLSRAPGSAPIWLCTILVFILLYNITEGVGILEQNSIYWVLYITTAIGLFPVCRRRVCAD
jgi:exopolysaccharide production protein ExoQ